MSQSDRPFSYAPNVVVLAGPNGAGKSTLAPLLLAGTLDVREFVNADTIAAGLSPYNPEAVAFAAGRIMLRRMRQLASERADFAFETTLAARTHARWLKSLQIPGYRCHVVFLALPSPELAIQRVAERVNTGGHHVDDEVIRRRLQSGLQNFFRLYTPIADAWQFYESSAIRGPRLIASASSKSVNDVVDEARWRYYQAMAQRP